MGPLQPRVVRAGYVRVRRIGSGAGAAVGLALVATGLGRLFPVVGAPVFAIGAGVAVAVVRRPPTAWRPGLEFASRRVLQGSIVVLGTALSFGQVAHEGASSLPVMLGTLAVALVGAAILGRLLGVGRDLRTLVGVGTAICGASAIAATDAVISADEADVSYAIATIFTYNIAAVLTFPSLGHLLGMSPHGFGLWAGTAINDMSSVVAAGTVFGHGATGTAVVVKLTRTLMILPVTLSLAVWRSRRTGLDETPGPRRTLSGHLVRAFPTFIAWFLVAVLANTAGLVPSGWHLPLSDLAQFMVATALAAIGLSTHLASIRRAGSRPLLLGGVLWVAVAATSLSLQGLTGGFR